MCVCLHPGRLAQLVERLPYKQDVTGSSPVPSIGFMNCWVIGRLKRPNPIYVYCKTLHSPFAIADLVVSFDDSTEQ